VWFFLEETKVSLREQQQQKYLTSGIMLESLISCIVLVYVGGIGGTEAHGFNLLIIRFHAKSKLSSKSFAFKRLENSGGMWCVWLLQIFTKASS
jgi:hypothetical protein